MKTIKKTAGKTAKYVSIEQALKEGNSSKNQHVKDQFVDKHVYACMTNIAEFILANEGSDNAPFRTDEIENLFVINESQTIDKILESFNERSEEFIAYANDLDTFNRRVKTEGDMRVFLLSLQLDELKEFCEEFNIDYEQEMQEIYEWWAVSEFLYRKLKEQSHPVADAGSCYLWGRPTTGQAILLDYVITGICADMEILEGQANSWAN